MNLKAKFAFWFALFVAIILSLTFAVIYVQSDNYRTEEFFGRLRQKALTTKRYFIEVREIDSVLLRIIDRNSLTTLPQEQVLIFDEANRLKYSNVDEASILFDFAFLDQVRRQQEVLQTDESTKRQQIGLLVANGPETYVVQASAYDQYGFQKMSNLRNILMVTWLLGLGIALFLAYLYVRNIVGRPLGNLTENIAAISGDDLKARLEVPEDQDELTTLARNFNELLERLERAFDAQRSFVQFASHELRTPLANMLSETENTLSKTRSPEVYQKILHSLREEQSRLIEMANGLLLLSHYEQAELAEPTPLVRVDEVLYNTIDEVRVLLPDARVLVDFAVVPDDQNELLVPGSESLLRTAFRNLIENACRYAENHTVRILIQPTATRLLIRFENTGTTLSEAEMRLLFTPFFRGTNTQGKRGFGLGLVIAQRILRLHKATLEYQSPNANLNCFLVAFANADWKRQRPELR
ncbi:MAG: HAMP domain-containing protein [Saprospiraceae bacterium]|nr:HAMP domain-containing protein [Saprospiraceae bacterium]